MNPSHGSHGSHLFMCTSELQALSKLSDEAGNHQMIGKGSNEPTTIGTIGYVRDSTEPIWTSWGHVYPMGSIGQ